MSNTRTTRPDGSVAFTCAVCKGPTVLAVDDGYADPVCSTICRFIRERIWREEAKARLYAEPAPEGGAP